MKNVGRVLLPLLIVGCADDATRPASWPPLVGAQRARFATDAPTKVVRANACALTGTFRVGQRERRWDVTVGDRRCSARPPADSIPLYVYMRYAGDQGTVVLEAAARDMPEDTLRVAVASTGSALKSAINRAQDARAAEAGQKHGNGGAIAAAAAAGGATVVTVVVVVVVVVVAIAGALAAIFSALAKAL